MRRGRAGPLIEASSMSGAREVARASRGGGNASTSSLGLIDSVGKAATRASTAESSIRSGWS